MKIELSLEVYVLEKEERSVFASCSYTVWDRILVCDYGVRIVNPEFRVCNKNTIQLVHMRQKLFLSFLLTKNTSCVHNLLQNT